ncbi:protein MpGID1L7 [Marchantia polymorpha subsp. ruderalis]|uniref:Alpha/beta hydrolase fold-3 domain-containing protein n=1 Tax=Marchantia polymorpha TaxID=3197 RepID=A0A2R6WV81_MARPO|nr:hypothetical protein MARPO_0055s0044 [Marchantia polymorpha]BBN03022.1 hypothetical protein Mp_2g20050 [Marchantia polymorpha subsp. ruderalis]|eukprot:PTQ37765.1 hypothetical protein MARPO_0055s0044 [Marchantia polymorpha]
MASQNSRRYKAESLEEVPVRSSFPLPWRIVCALYSVARGFLYRKNHTINRTLSNFVDITAKASSKPVDGVYSEDVSYGEHAEQYARVFRPANPGTEKIPVVFFFHGGGFAILCAASKTYDRMCRLVAKGAQAMVVSVNYRRAPEHRYPTAYDDCFEAIRWAQAECQSGGELFAAADATRVFFVGDSAGGNIAHFMMARAVQSDVSPLELKGVVQLHPFFGGVERSPAELRMPDALFLSLEFTDWFWAAFLPPGADRDHPACNVFGPGAEDLSGLALPPILVTIGSNDILQDWQARYVQKLRDMGKNVTTRCSDVCHAEYILDDVMQALMDESVRFIQSSAS